MISVSLLGSKESQNSSASLLELDMGSDSQLYENAEAQSASMELEDEVLVSMLVELENGMFKKRQEKGKVPQQSTEDNVPSPPTHSQSTPEAARKLFHQMSESLSCESMFTAADLVGISHDKATYE